MAHVGIPYERIPTDVVNRETLTDGYARINPMRSTPALLIGVSAVVLIMILADRKLRTPGCCLATQ